MNNKKQTWLPPKQPYVTITPKTVYMPNVKRFGKSTLIKDAMK